MKQLIKRIVYSFSWSYKILSRISQSIWLYRENQNKVAQMLSKYFENRIVQHWPFVWMKYIDQAHWSSLLPKLAGTYENLLHTWINNIICTNYQNIIDIWSAEWYYAVWLALKTNSKIYAFDQSIEAQKQLKDLANSNNCAVNIEINWICTDDHINKISISWQTLIICDIEWSEEYVLDNSRCPALNTCDILVECHDFIKNWICDTLIRRFQKTHIVEIVCDQNDSINDEAIKSQYGNDFNYIVSENRTVDNMKWLFMKIK